MANPQKENGHLDLANELVEALGKIRLSGEESQCLWVIFRKTYCWHKKEDKISLSQFALATGLKRPTVARALKKLLSKKIIAIIKKDNTYVNLYRFNKDFDQWQPLSKKIMVLSKKIRGVIKKDNMVLSKKITQITKESITKENSTKETIHSGQAAGNVSTSPKPQEQKPYEIITDLQRIICAYKVAKGFAYDDRQWDKQHFRTWTPAAKKLLEILGTDDSAIACIEHYQKKFDGKNLDWTLAAVARWASEWKMKEGVKYASSSGNCGASNERFGEEEARLSKIEIST